MLTDNFPKPALIHAQLALMLGDDMKQVRLAEGVYERQTYGGTDYVPGWDEWPSFDEGQCPYGVSDDWLQVLEYIPELTQPDREFVLFVTSVVQANQPSWGGWRWHKWGPYIGTHEIQHEYLYDEEDIEKVLCWHVYENPRN